MKKRRYTYLAGEDILLFKRRYTAFQKKIYCALAGSWMAGFLLMLLTLTACVGEELQKPLLGEGEGYLTLQIGAISAEVTSDPLTKATLENLPAPTEFSITIKDANNTVVKHYEKLSQIENPLVLNAGVTYTVEASHGKNEALQDTPYFFGNEKVTIQANTNKQVTVNASLANAMIIPIVTDSLKNHYKSDWTLTASVGETSLLLASAEAGIDTLYAHADSIVSLTFSGTNKADQNVSFKWTATEAVKASKAYTVECKPDLAAFKNIQVTATATHTKDSNGDLNGTDVTFNADINDEYKAAIDSFKVQVFNSNQQIIRTYTGSSLDNMTYEDTGWPYIPQGSTLSASVKLKAGDVIAVGSTFAVPAPNFKVEVSAQTSYSVYDQSGATEANKKDGSSIFNIGSTVKISSAILGNSNYANILPKVTYTTDTGQNSGELAYNASVHDFTKLAWKKHILIANASFDGAIASASMDCHVTGLPYSAAPPKIKGDFAWNKDGGGVWNGTDEYARLSSGGGKCTLTSPSLYIIKEIPIQISTKYQAYGDVLGTTFTMYLGDELLWSTTVENVKNTGSFFNPNYVYDRQTIEDTRVTSITEQNNFIKCTNSEGTGKTHSKVYYVNIYYR